jgi:glyoxalase family protein
VTVGAVDQQLVTQAIERDRDRTAIVRQGMGGQPARRREEGDVPEMIRSRRQRQRDLADNLRPHVQRGVGVAPRFQLECRPAFVHPTHYTAVMERVNGLHHITAISGPAQENVDFYAGVLGMRLVKRSVNQDDPGTYHLFYADAEGHPGSDLTFFPWAQLAPPRAGHGMATEVALDVPAGSLEFWGGRLAKYGTRVGPVVTRFGHETIAFDDPHGLHVALVESASKRAFTPWDGSPVPGERQVRGLFGAQLWERDAAATGSFLTRVLGFHNLASENGWTRYGFPDSPGIVDVRDAPEARRGMWGVGAVHHLAWRVDDEAHQLGMRERIEAAGIAPTPVIDRFWFKSVYFKEPGGVLFELATDGPGFAVDEDASHLGETLVLPPWLEGHRAAIQDALPPLRIDVAAERR